jgi:hypothetical protein
MKLRRVLYSASLAAGIPRPVLRSVYRLFVRNKSSEICRGISSNFFQLDGAPKRTNYRIAVVKAHTNCHGPWRSIGHEDKNSLLDCWPSKLLFWHLTTLLDVDWYLIDDPAVTTDFMYETAQLGKKVAQNSSGVVSQSDIDFDRYDVVISIDPILRVPKGKSTLFCYYMTEHTDRYYWISEKKPLTGYDLFLGHVLRNSYQTPSIPQSVPVPFIYAPTRSAQKKEEVVWVDARVVWIDGQAPVSDKTFINFPIEARTKPCLAPDPPIWDDAKQYLQQLTRCQYFLSVGRTGGSGQAVAEATAAGAICITDLHTTYSHILTHPRCTVNGVHNVPQLISTLRDSSELRNTILSWEKERLQRYFFNVPLSILEAAIEVKNSWLKTGACEQRGN